MPNPLLVTMLESVHLGGLIEECVLTIKKGRAIVRATDITESIYVSSSVETEQEDDQWGLGNLGLFIKCLKAYDTADVMRRDNRLIIKPQKGASVKYLLSEVDVIPTYKEEWNDTEPLEELMGGFDENSGIDIPKLGIQEFLKLSKMFDSNVVHFTINPKGRVFLGGGSESDHQFAVDFGKSNQSDFLVKLYGKHVGAIIGAIAGDATLYINPSDAVVIRTEDTSWVMNPIRDV